MVSSSIHSHQWFIHTTALLLLLVIWRSKAIYCYVFLFFSFFFFLKKNYMELHFALYISSYAIIARKKNCEISPKYQWNFVFQWGPMGNFEWKVGFHEFLYIFFPNFPSFEILVHQTHHTAHPHDIQTLCILKKI